MNFNEMTQEELQQHSEKLRAEITALRESRAVVARAIEAHEARKQGARDAKALGSARIAAAAQALKAEGVNGGAVGEPGAK